MADASVLTAVLPERPDHGKSAVPFALMAFLWASVAAWFHLGLGVAGYEVGVTHEDKNALLTFTDHISNKIDRRGNLVEVSFEGTQQEAPPVPAPPPPDVKVEKKEQAPVAKKEEKKKDEEKKKEEEKVEKKVAVQKKEEQKVTPPPPPLHQDRRIAVRQHADPNQQDDPEAHFIANEANRVKEEQVAQLTSHDRDDENPTPAKSHQSNDTEKGDSDKTKVAEADEHLGEENKAPGERGLEYDVQHDARPVQANQQSPIKGPMDPRTARTGGDGQPANQQTPPELAPGNTAPPSPNVESSEGGFWTYNIARAAGSGDNQQSGPGTLSRVLQPPSSSNDHAFGLGGNPGPGAVNLNLDNRGVVAAVGADELRREREADGERRRSEHRGVWAGSNFERWRSAIENYVSSVKPGNQTALNTAAVPFATYLNGMHNRIHPIFADSFLASLDNLPATHALNDQHLIARLEIVLTRDGHIVKMGIVKTSGVTAFDIAALDSVQRAQPFGQAPSAIISKDGQVYLHWEFHRDEVYACSTMNARPFMLNSEPSGPEQQPGPVNPPPSGPHERSLPGAGSREGMLETSPVTLPKTAAANL
jgi:TonB family protein